MWIFTECLLLRKYLFNTKILQLCGCQVKNSLLCMVNYTDNSPVCQWHCTFCQEKPCKVHAFTYYKGSEMGLTGYAGNLDFPPFVPPHCQGSVSAKRVSSRGQRDVVFLVLQARPAFSQKKTICEKRYSRRTLSGEQAENRAVEIY